MYLPQWFPSCKRPVTEGFKCRHVIVNVDQYSSLTHTTALFIYRGLVRTAHKKSLLPEEREKYEGNKHFKNVFSFTRFTPPWFPHTMDCKVGGQSLLPAPLKFDDFCIPQMRDFRARQDIVRVKLQGVIACFYNNEPKFSAATIDFLIDVCNGNIPGTVPSARGDTHSDPVAQQSAPTLQQSTRQDRLITGIPASTLTDLPQRDLSVGSPPHTALPSSSGNDVPPLPTSLPPALTPTPSQRKEQAQARIPEQSPPGEHSAAPYNASADTQSKSARHTSTAHVSALRESGGKELSTTPQRNVTPDPPLSPHSKEMQAFSERAKVRSLKLKRAQAAGHDAITANADSTEESDSDFDSSEFVPLSEHSKHKLNDRRRKGNQRKSSSKSIGNLSSPQKGASKKATSSNRFKKTLKVSKKQKLTLEHTDQHENDDDNEDCIFVRQSANRVNRFRTRHSQKSKTLKQAAEKQSSMASIDNTDSTPVPLSDSIPPPTHMTTTAHDTPEQFRPPLPVIRNDKFLTDVFGQYFSKHKRHTPSSFHQRVEEISLPSSTPPPSTQPTTDTAVLMQHSAPSSTAPVAEILSSNLPSTSTRLDQHSIQTDHGQRTTYITTTLQPKLDNLDIDYLIQPVSTEHNDDNRTAGIQRGYNNDISGATQTN